MIIVIVCAVVAAVGNYNSVKSVIGNKRFDLIGFPFNDTYAFCLTVLFDIFIIYFHLIKLNTLIFISVLCSWFISEYSWTLLMRQDIFGEPLDFIVCTLLATLPIVILNILMRDVAEELDVV